MTQTYIKGFLRDIVLHLIAEQGRSYGYALTREVQRRSAGVIQINEGALYPVLHQLENEGLLLSELVEEAGRIRKYYRLAQGQKAQETLRERQAQLQSYLAALSALFEPKIQPRHEGS